MQENTTQLFDETAINRSLARISHEIIEKNDGAADLVLIGIMRRGVPLAQRIAQNIRKYENVDVPVGYVDITLYRDDLSEISIDPKTKGSYYPVDITGKTVILVDDVIYTGRTVRAALTMVFQAGRPKKVQLAELIDRGHRELPIKPDYVGKNVPTSLNERIMVQLEQVDGINQVLLVHA